MKPKSIRATLVADPNVGAGNVLATVLSLGADPDGPGLTFDTEVDGIPAERQLTLGQLDDRVNARAAWLHQRGIQPRDPVAVWATEAADVILTYLALQRIGAIPALLNGKMQPEIAAEYLRRLRTVGVLADASHRELLSGHDIGVPIIAEPAELGTGDPAAAPPHYPHHQDDPVVITHSSGTTGVPKSVMHTHKTIYAATKHLLTMPQAQGSERILNALPIPHTATVIMVNQALGNRAEFLALSKQDGDYVLDAIERWRPASVFGFSVTWAGLARFDLSTRDLSTVRMWFNTGDCAHESHIRHLVAVGSHDTVTRHGVTKAPGSMFIDGLGTSETGHSMFHITHTVDSNHYGRCIGRPYGFVEAAVLDREGNELPPGEVGLLGLKAPSLSPTYWNDSVTTYRLKRNGWSLYGDVVYRDEDGRFYHMDRITDSVQLEDGTWHHTAMSEERVLTALPEVVDCTAVIVRDDDGTVRTDVLLELDPGADESEDRTERVRTALGEPTGSTLHRVVAVRTEDLPHGVTGKVRKFLLRARHSAGTPA